MQVEMLVKRDVPRFLLHSILSTVASVAAAFTVSLFLGVFVEAIFGKQNRILDYVLIGPSFFLPILMGVLLAILGARFWPSWTAKWVWVVPLLLLALSVQSWATKPYRVPNDIWDNFFGSGCTASECLYELVATAPFFSAASYALTAAIAALTKSRAGSRIAADV